MTIAVESTGRLNAWGLWTLRGLLQLGGSSSPRALEQHVAAQLSSELTPGQIARVIKNNYLRWASHELRKSGLLAGEYGTWQLTDAGRALAEQRRSETIDVPSDIEELPPDQANYDGPTENVAVTSFAGYQVPVLRALEAGPLQKQDMMAAVEKAIGPLLLPGDKRTMPSGHPVWRFRTSWTLTSMKKNGLLMNEGRAIWSLTESGRARLKEESAWSIAPFQESQATVRALSGATRPAAPPMAPAPPARRWPPEGWLDLDDDVPAHALEAIARRIRPELGPTPRLERGTLARNVILYGPPGTGKTHIATRIAAALTDEPEPAGDGAWRLVQFHPSYSYEDFVQGMRPDLGQSQLRYEMRKGPFLALCEAAAEDPDNFYVVVVDEINRGDPARIFGELLFALEYRGKAVDLALGGQLIVPPNVVVIGTMNSVDRSVALVDYALRRRFAFVRLDADGETITRVHGDTPAARHAARTLARLNAWLTARIDREHTIGHSFFLGAGIDLAAAGALDGIWREEILPLLEEYFVGDDDGLGAARQEWQKIASEPVE